MSAPQSLNLPANRVSFVEMLGHTVANITPSAMATVTLSLVVAEGGLLTWAVYLAVGFLMLLVAAQVAVLAREVPAAGSLFVSVSRTLHPLAGVLTGWSMAGGYLGALLAAPIVGGLFVAKALHVVGVSVAWPLVAVVFAGLAWALTVRDVERATRYSLLIEAASLLVILVIGVVTLAHTGIHDSAQWHAPFHAGPFLQAMTLSILAYGGFETAANFGREGVSPRRDVPLAILAAVLLCAAFYVFMAYAEMAGFANDATRLAHTEAPLSALATSEGFSTLAVLSDLAMAIAALSATIATLNSLGRLFYSMGRHKVLPAALGEIGRHKTPARALHILGALTTGFAVLAGVMGWSPLAIVNLFGVFTALGFIVIYVLAMIAVPVFRHRRGLAPSWTATLALVTAVPLLLYVFGENFWAGSGVTLIAAYGFIAYLLLGAQLYRVWRRRSAGGLGDFVLARDDD
ncbi:MAG TPA: APC family permease [Acidiferrobacter sp.]|nr:APC family permease [Acidiferrobacter sp.]